MFADLTSPKAYKKGKENRLFCKSSNMFLLSPWANYRYAPGRSAGSEEEWCCFGGCRKGSPW